jgi:hypothetical protein
MVSSDVPSQLRAGLSAGPVQEQRGIGGVEHGINPRSGSGSGSWPMRGHGLDTCESGSCCGGRDGA